MHPTRLLIAAAGLSLAAGMASAQTPAAQTSAVPAPAAPMSASQPAPAAASPTANKVVANGDIVQTIKLSGQFTTFVKAADATNLTGLLKNNQNLTVFAPTDAAFAALPPGELDKLMADKPRLQKLLTYHIINARVDSAKIKGARGAVPTVAQAPVELDGSGGMLMVNNADIIQPDVMATNGIIHVIDKVLTPDGAQAAASTGAASQASATAPAAKPAGGKGGGL
ncbi:fasciclin domain-containing protein [Phenylobacterium sp.]|jgi:uncharacterized surface protein with fasciclin (FAS1) repeats|uniref:fasciclin domain-containing protein n=1 Tax=Phenylobacterium sp. TaxID=1871053 RepID=UPI002F3F48C5